DYGEKSRKPDPAVVQKVTGILTEKFKVEVKHASVSDPTYTDAILSPGKLKLDNGETLDFDVYIPCYPVRPNTAFLTGGEGKQLLDASGAIISNECLQSQAYPEVFGVGVTTTKVPGHPVSARITIASQHCGKQALALLQGKEVQKFVDKGTPPADGPSDEHEDWPWARWLHDLVRLARACEDLLLSVLRRRISLLPASVLLVLHPGLCPWMWHLLWATRGGRPRHLHGGFVGEVPRKPWIQRPGQLWPRDPSADEDELSCLISALPIACADVNGKNSG
ncbi:unnamed protein product, partial [Durusdinium trenchii]